MLPFNLQSNFTILSSWLLFWNFYTSLPFPVCPKWEMKKGICKKHNRTVFWFWFSYISFVNKNRWNHVTSIFNFETNIRLVFLFWNYKWITDYPMIPRVSSDNPNQKILVNPFFVSNQKRKTEVTCLFVFLSPNKKPENQKSVLVFVNSFFHFSFGTDSRILDRQEVEVKCKKFKIKAKRMAIL